MRDLPDDVHATLQHRAEQRGQSLQQYLAGELVRLAERPTTDGLFDRISRRRGGKVGLKRAVADLEGARPRLVIVIDASVLANALADDGQDGHVARRHVAAGGDLATPDLIDVETVAVLHKRWLAGDLTARRFSSAIDDLEDLALERYPMLPLMRRAYELRANVTVYDATYIALAERLGCALLTADARLAAAPRIACPVTVVTA